MSSYIVDDNDNDDSLIEYVGGSVSSVNSSNDNSGDSLLVENSNDNSSNDNSNDTLLDNSNDTLLDNSSDNSDNDSDEEIIGGKIKKKSTKPVVKVAKIIDKVFNEHTECNFVKDSQVCSPPEIINKMKEFADEKGLNTNNKKVVTDIKKLLDCDSESCILKNKEFIEFANIKNPKEILDNHFKPEGPALNFDLLSNFNIDDVLDQFEKRFAHRKFLHIPFQMRDFERVGSDLATIDLADKFTTYNTFGVVMNTDYSTGGGIHWFALFGERYSNDKIVLEYFNSSGLPELPEVQVWLNKNMHHINNTLKIPTEIYRNTGIEYQTDMHSCGVYALAYIWLRLEGINPRWFKADNFNDELMHKLRKNLFRWEE